MVGRNINSETILNGIPPCTFRRSARPAVQNFQLRKGTGLPPQEMRLELIQGIPARAFHQTPKSIPARAAVYFCCTPHVETRVFLNLRLATFEVVDNSTANSELSIHAEFVEASLEIVGI